MKLFKKIIALVVCVALLSGVMCVGVFARQTSDYSGRGYSYYTYVGDSISWGYGLDENLDPLAAESVFERVNGSFTDIVGKTLEENFGTEVHCAACNGARLSDFRVALEQGLGKENPYTYPEDTFGNRSIERTRKLQGSSEYICDNLRNSDLVTVTLGANDMASCVINVAESFDFIDISKLQNVSDFASVAEYAAFALEAAFKQKNMLDDFTKALKSEISGLKENQKEVIKDIVELAPDDADIVIVGYFVPLNRFRLFKGTDSSLFLELLGTVFTMFNDAYEDIASQYSNVYYVDAPDASIFFEDGTLFFDALKSIFKDKDAFLLGIHPDADGHKYISEKVLAGLEKIEETRAAQAAASSCLPVRTISYVVQVVSNSIKNVKNNIKGAISSLFKR